MKRLLLIFITCLIGQLGLYAQNDSLEVTYRLSGLITDAQTGEPVPFVSVHNGPTWNLRRLEWRLFLKSTGRIGQASVLSCWI